MTVYTTDFSEYATGIFPGDWTAEWDAVEADYDTDTGGYSENASLDQTSGSGIPAISWDDVTPATDFDAYACVKFYDNGTYSIFDFIFRGAGAVDNETCVDIQFSNHSSEGGYRRIIAQTLTGGSPNFIDDVNYLTLDYSKWYTIRAQCIDDDIKIRFWETGTEEPATWDLEVVQTDVSGSGWAGVMLQFNGIKLDFVSIATGGTDTPLDVNAPTDPTPEIAENVSVVEETTVRKIIFGSVCYGHISGVTEDNTETFIEQWSGGGSVDGSGDAECLMLSSSDEMISLPVLAGSGECTLEQNKYGTGTTGTLYYRTSATYDGCLAAGWTEYTASFTSLGYVSIKATL